MQRGHLTGLAVLLKKPSIGKKMTLRPPSRTPNFPLLKQPHQICLLRKKRVVPVGADHLAIVGAAAGRRVSRSSRSKLISR